MKSHLSLPALARWAAIALLLIVLAAWAISGWWYIAWTTKSFNCAGVSQGALLLSTGKLPKGRGPDEVPGLHTARNGGFVLRWPALPSRIVRVDFRMIIIPFWQLAAMAVIAGLLPWLPKVSQWRQAARRRGGLCPSCAYPRKGVPADAPCPECGELPSP